MGELRSESLPNLSGDELDGFLSTQAQSCDWKASPEVVLSHVNFLLQAHDLEVVMLDTRDDSYAFRIARR